MWAEETDGIKIRGEPSRDFAKVRICGRSKHVK